jgi:MFS family permease
VTDVLKLDADIISEVPSNLIMKKASPKIWLPFITAAWGAITVGQGYVSSYESLLATRALLGLAEGGLLPGMVTYLSTLYRPEELAIRVGIAYLSNPLSGGVGGLLGIIFIRFLLSALQCMLTFSLLPQLPP